jgi:hypothetical protein
VAYVLLDDFKEYIRDQVSVDDAISQAALSAAEVMVNDFCQRDFTVASSSSARSYTPGAFGSQILRIHDCTAITSVVENGTTLSASAYQSEPLNQVSWSGLARPIEQLRRVGSYWFHYDSRLTVVVTATWGWTATPSPVVESTKIIAKDILQQRNNNSGVAGFGEFGAVRVRMNPIALDLLAPLRRAEAFGLA